MSTLAEFRQEKDEFFKTSRQSPLTADQKREFTGLPYFPENPALRLELALERFPQPTAVVLATSTGDEREYEHIGQITFQVEGKTAILQVYEADYGFFLPFADATAPDETYGAGRYLEPEALGGDRLAVDFNLAYNPYCACGWASSTS